MEIVEIEPNWWFGYGNSPDIVVTVDSRFSFDSFEYRACPDPLARSKTMLISTNNEPWVKFVYIDDPNGRPEMNGALGGIYNLVGGGSFKSRTGWSSREGVINSKYRDFINDDIVEVTLKERGSTGGAWGGFYIYASYLRNHPLWPKELHLVRNIRFNDNEVYHTVSVYPDVVKKPEVGK